MGHVSYKRRGLSGSRGGIKADLQTKGYVRGNASDFDFTQSHVTAFRELCADAAAAPPDPTIGAATFRRRVKGGFWWLPVSNSFEVMPTLFQNGQEVQEYTQPASYNSEAKGSQRFFAAAAPHTHRNPFLLDFAYWALENSPLTDEDFRHPLHTNFHLISLEAAPGQPANASPPHVHCDGETVTWAMLLHRTADGGENFVTDRDQAGKLIHEVDPKKVLDRFTLETPLEWYAVFDDLVAHHVEPVTYREGTERSIRAVLLLDFTPMRAVLVPAPH